MPPLHRAIRVGEEITGNYFDSTAIDTPLISGAVIFGVGWGLADWPGIALAPQWCRSPADERKSSSSLPPWLRA